MGIIDRDDYIASGAFTVLKADGNLANEVIVVFLRLKLILMFSLKFNTGTSYPTITNTDIMNFPIPILSTHIQQKIKLSFEEIKKTKIVV